MIAAHTNGRKAWADTTGGSSPATDSTSARRSAGRGPLRFIGVFTPHGCAHELWKPGPDFDLRYPGCTLAPFDAPDRFGRSFKDRLLVIDGLDLAAGIEVGTVGHDASRVILTGSGVNGKNPSVDQYLAFEKTLGADTPHTSITLAVGDDLTDLGKNISYSAGGSPVPKWIDPAQLFDELFGGPLTEQGRQELALLRARQRSVLDFVRGDLQRLSSIASARERTKLDQHHSALREIEKRLSPAVRNTVLPPRPDSALFPKIKSYGAGEPYFEVITKLHIDLLAQALSSDVTRFATLMLADLTRTGVYPDLPSDVHGDVAHTYWARTDSAPGKPETWQKLAVQNRHSYLQVARLMQRLDEADALDDTLILVQSDMGDPARHSSRNVPTLLAGGCGGRFAMGRLLDFRTSKGAELVPNNRLLVSVCQAFGVATERFGHSASAATVTGALDGLAITQG
jgi:hypothetical protein